MADQAGGAGPVTPVHTDPTRRHDFVLLFDVSDGNPNGDPDNGNLPRIDPMTGEGLVSDACLKRKVRDYVSLRREMDPEGGQCRQDRYNIYVQRGAYLSQVRRAAFSATQQKPGVGANDSVNAYMCQHYYDIRCFGGVLSTGKVTAKEAKDLNVPASSLWSAGQITGPVQLTFARSAGPVWPMPLTITRVALENPGDIERGAAARRAAQESPPETARSGQMGAKALLAYGFYRAHGFFSPALAAKTGVTAEDLALLWEALTDCWEHDRSAARGLMSCRGLYVFTHAHPLGDAPAHRLFDRVRVERLYLEGPARSFADIKVSVDLTGTGCPVVQPEELPAAEGKAVALTRLACPVDEPVPAAASAG